MNVDAVTMYQTAALAQQQTAKTFRPRKWILPVRSQADETATAPLTSSKTIFLSASNATRSARLPASIEPQSWSMPNNFAGLVEAMRARSTSETPSDSIVRTASRKVITEPAMLPRGLRVWPFFTEIDSPQI